MIQYIHVPAFIISLFAGLFIMLVLQPHHKVVHVFLTPENIDRIQYVDLADTCFEFVPVKTKCTSSSKPIQVAHTV